jgi:hypothetical protein
MRKMKKEKIQRKKKTMKPKIMTKTIPMVKKKKKQKMKIPMKTKKRNQSLKTRTLSLLDETRFKI